MTKTPNNTPATVPLRSGLLLGLFAVIGVAILAGVHDLTRDRIAEQQRQLIIQRLGQVLGSDRYDNDLLNDVIEMRDHGAFGHNEAVRIYRARKSGEPVAVIMELIATGGYNGDIVLLLGIDFAGDVTGARVIRHRETPGLGDPIEVRKSDWITRFTGRSFGDPEREKWAVRKDGGEFDQFTGATITPRAVVRAISRALMYHEERRDQLYLMESNVESE